MTGIRSRLSNLAQITIATMLGVLLAILMFVTVSSSPGHPELAERLDRIEKQITFISCISLVPLSERGPDSIAECQAAMPDEPDG